MSDERQQRKQDQEQLQAQNAAANASASIAQSEWERKRNGQLVEQLSDPDLFERDEWLGEMMGPDFGRSYILAQKDEVDLNRDLWLNENEAERMIHEHNPGRLCFGPFLALAQGVNNRPGEPHLDSLTAEEKRKTREAMKNKTARQSIAKDGKGLRSISEIMTTTKTESADTGGGDDGGRLSGLYDRVLG